MTSYSSRGICPVFQRRPQVSHCHCSPYWSQRTSPHSQVTVIGGTFTRRSYVLPSWKRKTTKRQLNLWMRGVTFATFAPTARVDNRGGGTRGCRCGPGAATAQDASLVRRLRHRVGESRLPPRVARLFGGRSRRLGRRAPVGDFGGGRRPDQQHLHGARDHVPPEVGGPRALCARGMAEVHDPRGADRDVR